MLRALDPLLSPDLLFILASMGHGDDLALVDRNFPAASVAAATVTGRLIALRGANTDTAARAILSLLPIDDFEPDSLRFMHPVGAPQERHAVHEAFAAIAAPGWDGEPQPLAPIERHAFYAAARKAYAVVQTGETRPYGCFLIRKGVIRAA